MTLIHALVGRRVALAAAALSLAACTTLTPSTDARARSDAIEGRLSVAVQADAGSPAKSMVAPFTLRGDDQAGMLELATPIGTLMARATWSPSGVVVVSPEGERRYASLDAMSEDLLGERLPMGALMSWLRGRPWPGAASQPRPDGRGFTQLNWTVDTSRRAEGIVLAARTAPLPAVNVRAIVQPLQPS